MMDDVALPGVSALALRPISHTFHILLVIFALFIEDLLTSIGFSSWCGGSKLTDAKSDGRRTKPKIH